MPKYGPALLHKTTGSEPRVLQMFQILNVSPVTEGGLRLNSLRRAFRSSNVFALNQLLPIPAPRMTFKPNQTLNLPELAAHVGSASAEFRVVDTLAGGMGECVRVVQGQEFFALKVIQNHLIDDAAAWHRYVREARSGQRCQPATALRKPSA